MMGKSVSVLAAIAALLLLLFWCGIHHTPAIEAALAHRVGNALTDTVQAMGGPGIGIRMDGRVAVLTGTLAREETRSEILRRVGAVAGVRRVRDQLQLATPRAASRSGATSSAPTDPASATTTESADHAPATSAGVTLALNEHGLTLRGTVPNAAAREHLTASAIAIYGTTRVHDELEVKGPAPDSASPATHGPGHEPQTADALATDPLAGIAASLLDSLDFAPVDTTLHWRDGVVTASGSVPDRASGDRFLATLRARASSIELIDRLTVVPPAPAEQVQARVEAVLRSGRVQFTTGSAQLLAEGERVLSAVARELRASPALQIAIEGHTDSTGDAANNLSLSRRRARAVRDFLAGRRIGEGRMSAEGFGETRPIADNASAEGRRSNRRIEFRVSEGGDE